MQTLIVTDIFGTTAAVENLALLLGKDLNKPIRIFSPYGKGDGAFDKNFCSEAEAYKYFSERVGLDNYASSLLQYLSSNKEAINLIGFSVGASAIWQISEQLKAQNIQMAVGFYGSQIRKLTAINPAIDIELIFPTKESHFSVKALMETLSNKPNVQLKQVEYLHGFMNSLSDNYNALGYQQWLGILAEKLKEK